MDITKSVKQAQSIVGVSDGRPEHDFYPTPRKVTEALLDMEKFDSVVWEPACGAGDMSEVLKDYGYKVFSSDLINRGYGHHGIDFLKTEHKWPNSIITNPPFKLAQEFVEHALRLGCDKLAIFAKLAFLESKSRKAMFEITPLKRVYVFSERVLLTRYGEEPRGSGMIAFAWFVWESGYTGEPTIKWI